VCAEFKLTPNIISTKTSRQYSTRQNSTQLVYLKQTDQAKQLISNAKLLRRSSNPATKDRVFINPNLTRAEASAAYQVRAQRRLAQQQRRSALVNERKGANDYSASNNDDASIPSARISGVDVSNCNKNDICISSQNLPPSWATSLC
jgi:hypothetical protein